MKSTALVRCYSTKTEATSLKARGEALDKKYSNVDSPLKRILINQYTEADLKVNYNDPKVLASWLDRAAQEVRLERCCIHSLIPKSLV